MNFLLDIIVILVLAKIFADISERLGFPGLIGGVLAGILTGPVLGIVDISNIQHFGEIGLILLLFLAGFEVDTEKLLEQKFACTTTSILASLIPFLAGFFTGRLLDFSFVTSLFLGTAMVATSISISLETFIEKNKLNTKLGRMVLGSAVLDDIISLLVVAFVVSFGKTGAFSFASVGEILLGLFIFALIFFLGVWLFPKLIKSSNFLKVEEAQFSLVIVLIILLSLVSDNLGLSTVLGAFIAGIILSKVPSLETESFVEKINVISEGFFIPFFFGWVGLQIVLERNIFTWTSLIIVAVAVLAKIIPAFFSGKLSKLSSKDSWGLGFGMVPRGEVTLVVAVLGKEIGAISDALFGSLFLLILASILITPLFLGPILNDPKPTKKSTA